MTRTVLGGLVSLLLITCVIASVRAQDSDTARDVVPALIIPNGLHLSFDHLLSIYEWDGKFLDKTSAVPGVPGSSDDTILLAANSRFLEANRITTTSTSAFVYADDPIWRGPVAPFISFLGNSYVTSGLPGFAAASLITHAVSGFGVAGVRYRPTATDLDISGAAGVAQESQSEINTLGVVARGNVLAPEENLGGTTILSASLFGDERFFNARNERYSNDWASFAAVDPVGGPATPDSNHAYLDASLERRDFFYSTDSLGSLTSSGPIKQERTAVAFSFRDSIQYPVVPNALTSTIDAAFEPSSITRTSDVSSSKLASSSFSSLSTLLVPNDISELRLYFGGRLDLLASSAWSMQGRMSYEERSQDVSLLSSAISGVEPSTITKFATTLQEASFSQRVTQADVSAHYALGMRDTLSGDFNENLLNYDTPSGLNDDDHDNLITSAALRFGRSFSENLNGGLTLLATRTHLVYLKSSRSGENNVSQSLALFSYANYNGPKLLAWASGEVFANYTVLDYLDSIPLLAGVGNYLLRGLTVADSLQLPTGIRPFAGAGPITLEEGATLRVSERGSYDAGAFSEVLSTRIAELSATVLAGMTSFGSLAPWDVRAGMQAFLLSRSGSNTTNPESGTPFQELERQTRIGPLIVVSLMRTTPTGPILSGSLWYSLIKDQTFDIPSITRTPQLESHLIVQWMF